MPSTAPMSVEQPQAKLSFAKVAASSYKPLNTKEIPPMPNPSAPSPLPTVQLHSAIDSTPCNSTAPNMRGGGRDAENLRAGNTATATRTGQWANTAGQQAAVPHSSSKHGESENPHPTGLVKPSANEDNGTQLSSSDGSVKPPSLDGKSIASGTTFALDEKESIRPDDSASLRAVEEEDVTSPPDSNAAGSRVGSDSGVARAFRDQLHEIAVMGPHSQRGAPPGRFPNPNASNPHALYDPNQSPHGIGRPVSQPVVNGIPNLAGPHALSATPDEKLMEALESPRDRLFVLKMEQDFIDFIKGRENEFALPNCNTFYRMLAHRLADYYLLGHMVDDTMTGVKISRTALSRIPPPLSGLPVSSKNANTPPADLPTRKIMRRGEDGKSGTNTTANSEGPSKTTSEAGGASGSENEKDKAALTREEREARYREARQRIFGSTETGEQETPDTTGSGEEKDASRSSSALGRKKSKKQRNYDDDFEARSRFNAYYPQQYSGFGGDQAQYFGGYPAQMQNPQFISMGGNMPPPSNYGSGYSAMPQDAQPQYGWPGQQYPSPNGRMAYPNYGAIHNGYDLSADFQRGMQSFQAAGMPSQVTPKMANPPMASYQDTYQAQPMAMNGGWSQVNPPPTYPAAPAPYTQNGPGNRPMSAPIQGPVPVQYPYGQFPTSPYNGMPNSNQHPLPGSFNRQQFNPQSQAFVPGGRNVPYQMQANLASMPPSGINGYGNYPMTNQMPKNSPPVVHPQAYGSPQGMQNGNPLSAMSNNLGPSQTPQMAASQAATGTPSSQSSSSSIPAQSSIAKWGTPAHLPPRPPAPAQPQAPKFSLTGSNNFSLPRVPSNPAPGYGASPPMVGGGSGPSMPNQLS